MRFYLRFEHLNEDEQVSFDTVEDARARARRLLARRFEQTQLMPEQCGSWSCVIQDAQRNFIERIVLASLVDGIGDEISGTKTFYPQ